MKLNSKEFEKLLDTEGEDLDFVLDQEKVNARINKLQTKEKHLDRQVYGNQDPKRKFKR